MSADGSQSVRLTTSPAIDQAPRLSPNGSQIAFQSNRNANQFQVFVMRVDEKNVYQVTGASGGNYFPTWSPDGKRIAIYSNRNGTGDIYVINKDGLMKSGSLLVVMMICRRHGHQMGAKLLSYPPGMEMLKFIA